MSEKTVLYLSRDSAADKRAGDGPYPRYVLWGHEPTSTSTPFAEIYYEWENKPALAWWEPGNFENARYLQCFFSGLHLEPGQLAKLTIDMEIIK